MATVLDCRGLECPGPVLKLRTLMENDFPTDISVYVDNEAAQQNVMRFLEHQNYRVSLLSQQNEFVVVGTIMDEALEKSKTFPVFSSAPRLKGNGKRIMVLISSTHMGHGDDGLGDMLMFNFIKTLKEMGPDLWRVVLINSGVRFTAGDSEAISILKELVEDGVQILACGACLAYFHVLDSMHVGEVTNMLEIITSMKESDSVITV